MSIKYLLVVLVIFAAALAYVNTNGQWLSSEIMHETSNASITTAPTNTYKLDSDLMDKRKWVVSGSIKYGFTIMHPDNIVNGDSIDNYHSMVMIDKSKSNGQKLSYIDGFEIKIKRISYEKDISFDDIVQEM